MLPPVDVRAALRAMLPPYTVTGPAMLMAPGRVMVWSPVPSAPDNLPRVKPPSVLPKVQPVRERPALKSSAAGSMRSAPAPLKPLLAVLGAFLSSTNVPAEIAVAPV